MPFPISSHALAAALLSTLALTHAPLSQAQPSAIHNPPAVAESQEGKAPLEEMPPSEAEAVEAEPSQAEPAESASDNAPRLAPDAEPLSSIARRMSKPLPLRNGHIVVLKSQRTLQLFDGATLMKSYAIALGPSPSGHKQKRGDGRTPEGEFFVCTRNAKTSAFHIFLGLSYPALPDAWRGAQAKLITPREAQMIRSRLASRSAPPWNTKLGGWVGIHGGSDAAFASGVRSKRRSLDWTAGCIAVSNTQIEEISAALNVGARVSIRP